MKIFLVSCPLASLYNNESIHFLQVLWSEISHCIWGKESVLTYPLYYEIFAEAFHQIYREWMRKMPHVYFRHSDLDSYVGIEFAAVLHLEFAAALWLGHVAALWLDHVAAS